MVKNIFSKVLSVFLFCLIFSSMSTIKTLANENVNQLIEGELWEDYSIDLSAKAGLEKAYTKWGIETVATGFKIAPISALKSWQLDTTTTFKIYDDNYNIIFDKTYNSGNSMKNIADDLNKVSLGYNYSFQLIPSNWETVVRINGYIDNNFDNHDYSYGITKLRGSHVRFKLSPTGHLRVEKINPKGLSILNNRFGIETSHIGVDTSITDLKFYQTNNGEYKLTRVTELPNDIKTVKNPFYIQLYNTQNGNISGITFSKQIPAGINMEELDKQLEQIPSLKMGDAIQFIAAPKNVMGEPKVYVKGGIINNYDFFDPANGMNNNESSRRVFILTPNGLEIDPLIM
ncbi:hypothetical protein [Clostridium perfringens]|uniref:hypothetical protein n=1 Tax=Clostridium perfringens TaxID=1502 RepID=UPI001A35D80D|nr:hypothetical protein [Clostridium perfringens]HAT4365335.1 hypothetical protein [Clostridium perfringens]